MLDYKDRLTSQATLGNYDSTDDLILRSNTLDDDLDDENSSLFDEEDDYLDDESSWR